MSNGPGAPTEGSDGFAQRQVQAFDEGGLNGTSEAQTVQRCAEGVAGADQHARAAEFDLAVSVHLAELTVE